MARNEITFDLIGGYLDPTTNEVIKEVTVRGLNGTDEEILTTPSIRESGVKIIRTILNRCVISVGDKKRADVPQNKWEEMMGNMMLNDQDYIIFKIRQATYGDAISFPAECPICKGKIEVDAELSELEIVPFEKFTFPFSLPFGIEKDGVVYTEGKMHHPLAKDRDALTELIDKSSGQANTAMIARCVEHFDVPLDKEDIRQMSMRDRLYLTNLLTDHSFGVKTYVEVDCIHCGNNVQLSLAQSNFI